MSLTRIDGGLHQTESMTTSSMIFVFIFYYLLFIHVRRVKSVLIFICARQESSSSRLEARDTNHPHIHYTISSSHRPVTLGHASLCSDVSLFFVKFRIFMFFLLLFFWRFSVF